jgi:uncharacterized protein HemX
MKCFKFLLIFSILILLGTNTAFTQEKDSSQVKKEEGKQESKEPAEKQKEQKVKSAEDNKKSPGLSQKELQGFIDQNANGIDDRLEAEQTGKGKGKGQPRDRFVDVDGDGICDGKESAIGLRKLFRKRQGRQNK